MVRLIAVLFGLLCTHAHAATNYEVSNDKCVAWSETASNGEYMFSFSPVISNAGNLQVYFLATKIKKTKESDIDTVAKIEVNSNMIDFSVRGNGNTIIFQPQDSRDVKYILELASTGSIKFNKITLKTGGTRSVIDYMFANCAG